MEDIKSTLEELRKEILCNRNEITAVNTNIATVVTSLEKILEEFQTIKSRVDKIENNMKQLENETNYLSRQIRSNNVIIAGVPEQETEEVVPLVKNVIQEAGVSLDDVNIDNVFRLGKFKGRRPILLKLNSNLKKQQIFQAKPKIRELGFNVFPDRSKKEREAFEKVKPYLIKFRKEGKEVKYRDGCLELEGRRYSEAELREMETAPKRKRGEEGDEERGYAAKLKQFAFRERSSSESRINPK